MLDNIFAFGPNRDTLGATAYFIVENQSNILVDCPAWDEINQTFLLSRGGVRLLFLTHRGAIGKAREIQEATGVRYPDSRTGSLFAAGIEGDGF